MKFLIAIMFAGVWSAVISKELFIASFNVQIFGQSKIKKQPVVDELIKIISRYDLILIQEIRDKKETAIIQLLEQVNAANDNAYSHVISDRLGRTTSKEQYCFFYKTSDFTVVDDYVYSDPGDLFEREPFNVRFNVTNWALPDLVFSAIHTKPDDAVEELSNMVNVYEDMFQRWNIEEAILMGDFNADCSYVSQKAWVNVRLRTDERFQWFIDDTADTTVRATVCAYDRFAIAGEDLQNAVSDVAIFNFHIEYGLDEELAEDVSDHYPIELKLSDG